MVVVAAVMCFISVFQSADAFLAGSMPPADEKVMAIKKEL